MWYLKCNYVLCAHVHYSNLYPYKNELVNLKSICPNRQKHFSALKKAGDLSLFNL